jgi:hypothetical protein
MAVWYSLWSFGIFFPFWNVWTKKNLATLILSLFVNLMLNTILPSNPFCGEFHCWDRCYDFLIFSPKNFAKKLAFLTQNKAKF